MSSLIDILLKATDQYYHQQPEPEKSCLLALRSIILSEDKGITEAWKYRMPFFCYHSKIFCYLWFHKTYKMPYLGIMEGKHIQRPELLVEKRARIKILLIDPSQDLPVENIRSILQELLQLYKSGFIKVGSKHRNHG